MSSGKSLILASHSARREQLLAEAGYGAQVIPPRIQEPNLAHEGLSPEDLAQALAYFKAREVADRCGVGKVVLAADTVVVLGEDILGKADGTDEARRMLKTLSRNTHRVITALAVIDSDTGRREIDFATTTVTMKPMSDDQIEDYIRTGFWQDKAGAYAVQQGADKYINRIEGSFTNVVGLPMELVGPILSVFAIHPEE